MITGSANICPESRWPHSEISHYCFDERSSCTLHSGVLCRCSENTFFSLHFYLYRKKQFTYYLTGLLFILFFYTSSTDKKHAKPVTHFHLPLNIKHLIIAILKHLKINRKISHTMKTDITHREMVLLFRSMTEIA